MDGSPSGATKEMVATPREINPLSSPTYLPYLTLVA